jgi:hypothetical protein
VPLNPPVPASDRGFLLYGGSAVRTSYGHPVEVRVQESSAASGPHCWLFTDESSRSKRRDPHLSLADAIEIRDRLTQFIEDVPDSWTGGKGMLAEARKEVERRREAEAGESVT